MQFNSLVLGAAFATAVLAQTVVEHKSLPGLNQLLESSSDLSTLNKLFNNEALPLLISLERNSDITVLAPTDTALATFFATPQGAKYKNDPDAILDLLEYHVLQGEIPSSKFTSKPAIFHSILQDPAYTNVTLEQAVEIVRQEQAIQVISGNLNISKIIKPDVKYARGVVHIIDKVLTIPASISATESTLGYTEFDKAFQSKNLKSTIESLPDITLFIPINAAFQATRSRLPKDPTTLVKSRAVQKPGTVYYSTELHDGQVLTALNGKTLKISVKDGRIYVNGAVIIVPDILTANGVIHAVAY